MVTGDDEVVLLCRVGTGDGSDDVPDDAALEVLHEVHVHGGTAGEPPR